MISSPGTYVDLVTKQWMAYNTGGRVVGVVGLAAATSGVFGALKAGPAWAAIAMGCVGLAWFGVSLPIATFAVWKRARLETVESASALADARAALAQVQASSPWKFTAEIISIQVFTNKDTASGETAVFGAIHMKIKNLGSNSLTENWQVSARSSDGAGIVVDVLGLEKLTFDVPWANGKTIHYRDEHCIYVRARSVIESGGGVDGILPCAFRGIATNGDLEPTSIRVVFNDVAGNEWESRSFDPDAPIDEPRYYNPGLPMAE